MDLQKKTVTPSHIVVYETEWLAMPEMPEMPMLRRQVGLADKYEYEYWSTFLFIFKDFGLNLIIFMFIDWLCLNMNIFTSGRGSKSIIYQLQFNQSFMY